jgi:tetratricopeptide (TPR) repeat protein
MNRKQRRSATKRGPARVSPAASPVAVLARAAEHLRSGQVDAAETECRRVLDADPGQADALHMMGQIALERDDTPGAATWFQKAAGQRPDGADIHYNLGTALMRLGRFAHAESALRRATALAPAFAPARLNLGNCLRELGQLDGAAEAYRQAMAIKPDYPQAQLNLGSTLIELGEPLAAEACYRDAIARHPGFAPALLNLGNLLRGRGELDEALALLNRAIETDPSFADAHNSLGNVYRDLGRIDEARGCYRAALSAQPDHARAHANLAYITTHGTDDPDVAAMESLLAREGLDVESETQLRFGLAKAYEESGEDTRSFDTLCEANRLRRASFAADAETAANAEALADLLVTRFDEASRVRHQGTGFDSELPVFIVGMPRSGTSLVEQILASHPAVYGAGELNDLSELLAGTTGRPPSPPEQFDALSGFDASDGADLGRRYVERLIARAPDARRITDKMPSNFVNLGLIDMVLPRAQLIHCVRSPMDTCLSCFKIDFNQGQTYYNDLVELGQIYHLYARLMDHWERVMPGKILHVSYERVTADLEGEARRLLAHCGLDWDERVLDFHKTERAVRTASAAQVREPIYRKSVERWRRYETQLAPLIEALGEDARDPAGRWPVERPPLRA